jgi:hypothetical protein
MMGLSSRLPNSKAVDKEDELVHVDAGLLTVYDASPILEEEYKWVFPHAD